MKDNADRILLIVKLIEDAIKSGILQKDPRNNNNILVYREAGNNSPAGFYSDNILSVAAELANNRKQFYEFCEAISNEKRNLNERRNALSDASNDVRKEVNIMEFENYRIMSCSLNGRRYIIDGDVKTYLEKMHPDLVNMYEKDKSIMQYVPVHQWSNAEIVDILSEYLLSIGEKKLAQQPRIIYHTMQASHISEELCNSFLLKYVDEIKCINK